MREADVWDPYHRGRNRFFAVCLGGPLAMVPLMMLSNAVPAAGVLVVVALPIVAVSFMVQNYRLSRWPCPRCERPFCWRRGMFNPFAERCMHCGIRTGDDPRGG